jgi:lipooligosaccharide transport system permease protein
VSAVSASSPLRPLQGTGLLVLRNYTTYRNQWKLFVTGFLEPVFYLFSIGIGVGKLIHAFELNGHAIPYAEFVAPGMLAASAFNGALLDSTFNVFFKLKYEKLYDQMLATPLTTGDIARGEILWGQLRGASYSVAFLLVMWAMGLVHSWWAVLALPATLLIGFAFSAVCMAITTWMTSWQDFDKITLIQLPLFLFSGTFFPVDQLPDWLEPLARVTPLWHAVELCRGATTGTLSLAGAVGHSAFLLAVVAVGCWWGVSTFRAKLAP